MVSSSSASPPFFLMPTTQDLIKQKRDIELQERERKRQRDELRATLRKRDADLSAQIRNLQDQQAATRTEMNRLPA